MNHKVLTIGFDGLNKSGKGTQIDLFKQYLDSKSVPCEIVRGDGTRAGKGLHKYDTPSRWWIEQREELTKLTSENYQNNLNLCFQRLYREIEIKKYCLEKKLNKETDYGVLIFDRTVLSHFFTMRQYNNKISFEESLFCYNPKNKKIILPKIPEINFILSANKDILMSRLEKSSIKIKKDFSLNYVSKYFDLFEESVQIVNHDQKMNLFIIDSSVSEDKTHKTILEIFENVKK
jgi:thymidylate kinase